MDTENDMTKEEIIDLVTEFINSISTKNGERATFGCTLITEIMNWSSYNYYEAMGIAKTAMDEYKRTFDEIMDDEIQENNNLAKLN
jgi:hypothetical protein